MPTSTTRLEQIMGVASTQQRGLVEAAGRNASAVLTRFDGWYNGYAASDLATRLGRVADNVANQAAVLANTSTALMIREMTGHWPNPAQWLVDGSARYGVTAFEAYNRIPRHYRYAISQGKSPREAVRSTIDRTRRMLDLEAGLASREQYRSTFAANHGVVDGFRRVIRPELSKTGTCGLCVAASDQIYTVETLMPIHAGCNCAVMPIVEGWDPGDYVNRMDMRRLYETSTEGGETTEGGVPSRSQLSSTRVTIDEHGEYGPMLRNAEHNIQRLEELTEKSRDKREIQYQERSADIERRYRDALVRRASGVAPDADLVDLRDKVMRSRTRTRAWSKFYGVPRATRRRGYTSQSVVDLA